MPIAVNSDADPGAIRARRQQLGLTQAGLAVAAGCSLSFVRTLESGLIPTRSRVLPEVLAVLNDEGTAEHGASAKERDDPAHPE